MTTGLTVIYDFGPWLSFTENEAVINCLVKSTVKLFL